MRLHEHEGVEIFDKAGIPVPRYRVVGTVEEALKAGDVIGYPVMVKAQVLVGGRGLAGGIQPAGTPQELETHAGSLIGSQVRGLPVRKVMVCARQDIAREFYMGVTVDGYEGKPVLVVSTEGGVRIEETASKAPEKVASFHVEPGSALYAYQARNLLKGLGVSGRLMVGCADVLVRLYKVFADHEAIIAEINPLAVLEGGGLSAVDAVLEVDDSAVSRIPYSVGDPSGRLENPLESKAKEIGVSYVDLDGDIGIIASGAGLGMASMDIIGSGDMRPANFLETGGGITADLLYNCMELLMMKEGLRAVFINIYGGINPIHEGAKGVVRYMKEHEVSIPVVAKALGNLQEETWKIFRAGGVHVVTEPETERAVERLGEIVGL